MATVTANHAPTLSSDALFRAWSQFINDALVTTSGWVDTAATGEVNLSTMTAPATNNTFAGYKVYRMADSLQATAPIFLKVEYGRGPGVNYPGLRLSIGTTHDGAGTLTGTQVLTAQQVSCNATSASSLACYASGSTNRFAVVLFADNTGAQYTIAFGVERTKDSTGADDSTGVVLSWCGHSGSAEVARVQVIPPSGGVPATSSRWNIPFDIPTSGSAVYGATLGVALLVPYAGDALRPTLNWGMLNTTDIPVYNNTLSATCYGSAVTFLSVGSGLFINRLTTPGATSFNGRLLMRYD